MNAPNFPDSPLRLVRVGLLVLDADRRITSLDATARALVAPRHDARTEFVGRPLLEVIAPAHAEDLQAALAPVPTSYLGQLVGREVQLLVHLTRVPCTSGEGQLVASVVAVNDYLAETQARARVQLRNTVESIIAGFAHEVRNPLAAILSLTEAAIQQQPSPDSVLVRIPGLVARVESLIKHSLAYSRPKAPRRSLHRLSFLLDRAHALLRPRQGGPQLVLPGPDAAGPAVMADQLQIEQVLVNLMENALDAARSRVEVTVTVPPAAPRSVCVSILDDGEGVPAEHLHRIFDPFFTTKAHGTGLGLAIARDLTRLNGGDLRVEQREGGGAAFHMFLSSTSAPVRAEW